MTDEPRYEEATPPFIKGSKFDANRVGLGSRTEVFKVAVQYDDPDPEGYDIMVYKVVVLDESEDRLGALHAAITPLLPKGEDFAAMAAEALSLLNYFVGEGADQKDVHSALDERLHSLYPERLDFVEVKAMLKDLERSYLDAQMKEAESKLRELRRDN